MEEKKKVSAKTESTPKKLSYEQLEEVAHQLSDQNKALYEQLQIANMSNMFKRLDYLFKVVEAEFAFNSDFVAKCSAEIKEILTLPEDEVPESTDSKE